MKRLAVLAAPGNGGQFRAGQLLGAASAASVVMLVVIFFGFVVAAWLIFRGRGNTAADDKVVFTKTLATAANGPE